MFCLNLFHCLSGKFRISIRGGVVCYPTSCSRLARANLLKKASLTMPPDPPSLPNRASSFPPVSGPGSASSCSSGGSPLWSELISRSWLTSTPSRSPGPHLPPPPLSEIATGFSRTSGSLRFAWIGQQLETQSETSLTASRVASMLIAAANDLACYESTKQANRS